MSEQTIFDYLVGVGMTKAGAAGMVGNMIHESGLKSDNLENTYNNRLGMTDEQYTKAVDSGQYKNFVHDSAGYGLCQWTYYSRKEALLQYANYRQTSISDARMQLDFLVMELKGYKSVWDTLTTTDSVYSASNAVLLGFERPADQGKSAQDKRAATSYDVYARCAGEQKAMNGSSLATVWVNFGTVNSNPRTEKVSKITIHHMAGNMGAEECARYHLRANKDNSANYYIGSDGVICLGVEESRRAWTSGSSWNDQRAITIEVANSTGDPDWKVSGKAYNSLIALCADICKRYKITPHWDGTKDASLTEHRMFQSTACPGPYIHGLLANGTIERDILKAMGKTPTPTPTPTPTKLYKVQAGAFKNRENASKLCQEINNKGIEAVIVNESGMYKVQCGAFSKRENALKVVQSLQQKGYKAIIK